MLKLFRQLPFGMLGGLLLLLAAACSGTPTVTLGPTATPPPGLNGPEYGAIVITTDLALGSNRVVFGIVDRNGMPVRSQQAKVRALYLPPGDAPGVERASGVAGFKKWRAGPQGCLLYTSDAADE